MNTKKIKRFLIFLFLLLTFKYWFPYFNWFLDWFTQNNQKLKNMVAGIFFLLSFFMYVKIKLVDSGIFNKLSSEMGKTKLLLSIRIIGEMLDIMSPEDVVNRLNLVSKTEIEMRKSVKILNKIFKVGDVEEKQLVKLTKKQEKVVISQIQKMLEIIDKRKAVKQIEKLPSFDEILKKSTEHQKNIEEKYIIPKRKKALSKIIFFSKSQK